LPAFGLVHVRRHLEWFAKPGSDGLVFVGEKGAALRGTTFGRKWRKARDKVGLPKDFRFYDLRHTGNTLAADTGAKLKDLMSRGPVIREGAADLPALHQEGTSASSPLTSTATYAASRRERRRTAARARQSTH
jgi:integrase